MKNKRTPGDANYSLFDEPAPTQVRAKPRNRKELGIPDGLDLDRYERDEDGRLREIVGPWVRDKHGILKSYVTITSPVRKKWVAKGPGGATFIELFAGPGSVRIENTPEALPGSPLVAWNACQAGRFTDIYVADAHRDLTNDCVHRLQAAGAPVHFDVGLASETVDRLIAKLNPCSYHLVFLDPYALGVLSFDMIQKLSQLKSVDFLIHVSAQDLNRNLRRFIEEEGSSLDRFAPRWRSAVDVNQSDAVVRTGIFNHWKNLLGSLGIPVAGAVQLVSGETNQPLYWLALAARHPRAHEFWEKILPKKAKPVQTDLLLV